ncbi:MAG TPA: hypothetical protein PLV55_00385 [Anaerohalosphaeraceae bacterium]|nr:hypothetical protein [Anaerohalosphaeraceae bacterium]HOL87690.1 hypothetical protein [Anaerohalosphaeraceae bacterium]
MKKRWGTPAGVPEKRMGAERPGLSLNRAPLHTTIQDNVEGRAE